MAMFVPKLTTTKILLHNQLPTGRNVAVYLRNFSQCHSTTRRLGCYLHVSSLLPVLSYQQSALHHHHPLDWLALHSVRQLSQDHFQRSVQNESAGLANNFSHENNNNDGQRKNNRKNRKIPSALAGGGFILGASLFFWKTKEEDTGSESTGERIISVQKHVPELDLKSKQIDPTLPVYFMNEVAQHYNTETGIWVSFNRGVYDVSQFVAKHPGGNRLLLGAGGSLEPFWELYPVHQRSDVLEILEKYRIGNLAEEDVLSEKAETDNFKEEPRRHPSLIIRSQKPFNGETPPAFLFQKFFTPNDLFYVRNHLPVPEVDAKSYELEITGINIPKSKSFTLAQLKKLPKVEISATIQCGGNRRSEMGKSKAVAGLSWSGGAIGNANWAGASLKDVLREVGFKPESYKNPEKIHVQFEGMDSDPSGECYGASVPLSYILDGNFNPVLAYEMNSKTLPLDHGFPIRIILPGIVGARSVKWLSRIVISDQENQSPWQQRDYKVFTPSTTMETVNFADAPAIMDTPPTSYICSHEHGQTVQKGVEVLKGYAFSGGGRDIVRVELSADQGKTWTVAKLIKANKDGTKNWSWVLWELPYDFAKMKGDVELWVKSVDSGYNQQTENFQNIWNYRGLMSNAYHKIKVHIK